MWRQGGKSGAGRRSAGYWLLALVLVVMITVEMVLLAADLGLWGQRAWRLRAFRFFAFRPELLAQTRELWPGQARVMWISHIFLHLGPVHLAGNVLAGLLLRRVMPHVSAGRFALIGLVSALAGACAFAIIGPEGASMTGLSAALCGVAAFGIVTAPGQGAGAPPRPMLGMAVLGVLALPVLPFGLAAAWQAHLGGVLAGLVLGLWWRRGRI